MIKQYTPCLERQGVLLLGVTQLVLNGQRLQDNLCRFQIIVAIKFYSVVAWRHRGISRRATKCGLGFALLLVFDNFGRTNGESNRICHFRCAKQTFCSIVYAVCCNFYGNIRRDMETSLYISCATPLIFAQAYTTITIPIYITFFRPRAIVARCVQSIRDTCDVCGICVGLAYISIF